MTEDEQAEAIDAIRRRFRDEWLLIAIEEIDQLTTIPLRGRLIAHSPTRDPLATRLQNADNLPPPSSLLPRPLYYLTRSDHRLPTRHASAF
jgi:hypothetical protein